MNATITPATVAIIVKGRESLELTRYLDLSASVALIFDYLVTFEEERRHFWTGKWSWPRVLFFLNRYFAIIVQLFDTSSILFPAASDSFCKFALIGFLPWTGMIQIFIVQAILGFRLHAMYGKSKRILVILATLYISTSLAAIGVLGHQLVTVKAAEHVTKHPMFAGVDVCITFISVKNFWTFGVPVAIFDAVAFCLASYKAYGLWTGNMLVSVKVSEDVHVTGSVRPKLSGPRLMRILVNQSLSYFCLISAVYAVNIFIWRLETTTLSLIATGWSLSALSIAGNRMLLSIREVRAEDSEPRAQTIMVAGDEYFEFSHLQAGRKLGKGGGLPMPVSITSTTESTVQML